MSSLSSSSSESSAAAAAATEAAATPVEKTVAPPVEKEIKKRKRSLEGYSAALMESSSMAAPIKVSSDTGSAFEQQVLSEEERMLSKRSRVDSRAQAEVYKLAGLEIEALRELDVAMVERPAAGSYMAILNLERQFGSVFANRAVVEELVAQKDRIDEFFVEDAEGNNARELYYDARDRLFPEDKRGGREYWNRAGDKLKQVNDAFPFFDERLSGARTVLDPAPLHPQYKCAFFDICGGPGAFSQCLLRESARFGLRPCYGVGVTLESANKSEIWYRWLLDQENLLRNPELSGGGIDGGPPPFRPLRTPGAEARRGDVYVPEHQEFIERELRDQGITVCVADGGFSLPIIDGKVLDNYQELYCGQLILAEFLLALRTLRPGGAFVCKMFDTFSEFTVSLLFIAAVFFTEIGVVKPPRSRLVNSERYFVARGFREDGVLAELREALLGLMKEVLLKCDELNHGVPEAKKRTPVTLVPMQIILRHTQFVESVRHMNDDLAKKQKNAISRVVGEAGRMLEELNTLENRKKESEESGKK